MSKDSNSPLPFYDEIRIYAVRLTGNWSWGEDILQETYLRFFESKSEIQSGAQRAWLYRTARNLFIDQFRRNQRTQKVENILKTDILPEQMARKQPSPERGMEREELSIQILEKVNLLPARQREVVLLKFQQQLSYDEIAQITGETKPTIGWLLHEALLKLRKYLADLDRNF